MALFQRFERIDLLTSYEAAAKLGIRGTSISGFVRRHGVPYIRGPRRLLLFDPDELDKWMASNPAGTVEGRKRQCAEQCAVKSRNTREDFERIAALHDEWLETEYDKYKATGDSLWVYRAARRIGYRSYTAWRMLPASLYDLMVDKGIIKRYALALGPMCSQHATFDLQSFAGMLY